MAGNDHNKTKLSVISAVILLAKQVAERGVIAVVRLKTGKDAKFSSHVDWDNERYDKVMDDCYKVKYRKDNNGNR